MKKRYGLFSIITVIILVCIIANQTQNVLAAHLDYFYGRILTVSENRMYVRTFNESNNIRRGEKVRIMLRQEDKDKWSRGDRVELSYLMRVPGTRYGMKELDMQNTTNNINLMENVRCRIVLEPKNDRLKVKLLEDCGNVNKGDMITLMCKEAGDKESLYEGDFLYNKEFILHYSRIFTNEKETWIQSIKDQIEWTGEEK